MMRRSDRAIRPPSYSGFRDHSEENPNEDSVSASQRVSDDEQEDSYNETEDKIENEEQHTGATQQLRVMTLSEQDHYHVVRITENVPNCLFDAFGGSLDISKEVQDTEWGNRWTVSVNLQGKLYLVPGGNIDRKYVDLLTKEVCQLNQNQCSERLLVFSRLILQRDLMIKTTSVARALIGRRLEDWEISKFNILLQEAKRCSQKQTRIPMKKNQI